jgi:hypothetical protein
MDGLRLQKYTSNGLLLSYLKQRELKLFKECSKIEIDKIVKLVVSPEVSVKRKPLDLTIDEAMSRTDTLNFLNWNDDINISIVDADKPQDDVLNILEKEVWSTIS